MAKNKSSLSFNFKLFSKPLHCNKLYTTAILFSIATRLYNDLLLIWMTNFELIVLLIQAHKTKHPAEAGCLLIY